MIRFGSGSYNVRDSEQTRDECRGQRGLVCTVYFLDESHQEFELDRHARGQELLDRVFDHLDLIEKDYFGLQFVDVPAEEGEAMRWLEPAKSIRKQMLCPPYMLFFHVKFYVSDPSKLQEEYTRYHFFLQLRKDLLDGKMQCPESSAALLGSYAVQSELGDYCPAEHPENYLENFNIVQNQTQTLLRKISELHKLHRGQTPADAEYNFLDHAKRLDMFGVDLYPARDSQQAAIDVGVSSYGLVVFQNNVKINTFSWANVLKISFKRKQFFITVKSEKENIETLVGFNVNTTRGCKLLWKSCIEHHTFFRLISPPSLPPKGIFSLGSRFRYSGRTEYQTLEEMKRRAKIERTFHRAGSKTSFARSTIGASTVNGEWRPPTASPASSPFINRAQSHRQPTQFVRKFTSFSVRPPVSRASVLSTGCPMHSTSKPIAIPSTLDQSDPLSQSWTAASTLPDAIKYENGHMISSNGHEKSQNGIHKAHETPQVQVVRQETTFGPTVTSKVLGVLDDENLTEHSFEFAPKSAPSYVISNHVPPSPQKMNGVITHTNQRPSTSVFSRHRIAAQNGLSNGHAQHKPNGHVVHGHVTNGQSSPVVTTPSSQRSSVASRSSMGSSGNNNNNTKNSPKRLSPVHQNGICLNGYGGGASEDPLVSIAIKPDHQGRFGFNVKGGADQHHPIIVSRVAPGSPSDTCIPRLNEGDQVLMINGRDVSSHTHDQVVTFIRSAREVHSGELLLTVRPTVYIGEDVEEPEFQYIPETPHVAEGVPRSNLLQQSLLLLRDSVASGTAIVQFEQLYRKKPGLCMNACRLPENQNKNRYRDVSPYDSTRVIIQHGETGDYINANFVKMDIPGSGIVNRYIAAQGPLPHTTNDFWQAVWEQVCSTLVMLTTTVERGRVKCHQYWPRLYETQDIGNLQVTCLREKETDSTALREFSLVNRQTKEERQVSQMQYMAWPDHGVPEDPHQFVQFVGQVRKSRAGSVDPVLVHCSAGIGRTGVLILMETAMCLIEANEPVYPLDIVRTMRDQRAMLIQTSSQYKFVCESILKAYTEQSVQPLAEYAR